MTKQTVKEFLAEYTEKNGWGSSENALIEVLQDSDAVWKGELDEHRWYIIQPVVKEIDGKFIAFDDYIITGDNSMSDMDLEYDLDGARFVERKERQVTEIYYE